MRFKHSVGKQNYWLKIFNRTISQHRQTNINFVTHKKKLIEKDQLLTSFATQVDTKEITGKVVTLHA